MDYLELCRRFGRWIIDHLPPLGECSIAAQQRFINLIDVLYDQDKHLTLRPPAFKRSPARRCD